MFEELKAKSEIESMLKSVPPFTFEYKFRTDKQRTRASVNSENGQVTLLDVKRAIVRNEKMQNKLLICLLQLEKPKV